MAVTDRPVGPPQEPSDNEPGQMTLFEHLAELRTRVIVSVVAVIVTSVVAWFFYGDAVHFMTHPYREYLRHHPSQNVSRGNLVITGPLEGFTTRLKISVYLGIALAAPV